jgi:HK97 family phage major capsid protein
MDDADDADRAYQETRPYPNEHAARIKDPEQYDGFRRMNDELGDGIHIILGLKDGTSEIQSIRFDKDKWSVDDARAWLIDNGYQPLEFEPATEDRKMERAEPDELSIGDFVEWESAGGMARGQIEEIVRDGQIEVPDTDVVINGEPDDPAALIRIFDSEGQPSDVMVGHRFSTLTKIDPIEPAEDRGNMEEERKAAPEVVHRAMELDPQAVNADERRVRMAVSSEAPVERSFGIEVLEHSAEAIDLSFLNSGRAPLLLDHDPEQQIGVIESVDLDGSARRLRATVRFGKGPLAREVFDDVVDGIRANVSIGYAINKLERKEKDTYVAKSWRPVEASIVSIPADVTVGVGRSGHVPQITVESNNPKEVIMTDQVDIAAVEAEARKAAQRSAAQIVELGSRHNQGEMARKAIAEGKSVEEFRGELLEVIGSERALEAQEIGMTKKEQQRFSIIRAIHALANPTDRRAQEAAAFEFECSRAAADQYGRAAQGILLPAEVLRNWKRDLNSSDEAALFTDDFRGGDFIDVLRNSSSVMQAGARMLNGLSGDVKIPKKTAAAAAGWIATEGGASAESEMTVGSVTMTPKTLGAHTDVTRQLLIQSSLDVEALIRDDLAQAIALAIDLGALSGSGSSGQPTGIKNTSGINTVDFGTAPDLVPTFAQIIEMETKVREDNGLTGAGAYIMGATMYGALKSTTVDAGSGRFVVEPGGTINGYRAIVSNQAASGDAFFGSFDSLLVGMFSGLDIVVDPYTASTSGTVRVVALQSCDVAVRHAVSFCLGNDGGS